MISRKIKNDNKEAKIKDLQDDDLILADDYKTVSTTKLDTMFNERKVIKKEIKKSPADIQLNDEKKHKTKRLFFGLGKEFWRITWPNGKKIFNDMVTSIIVLTFFVLLFTGIGILIGTFVK
ncbi:MAG: hypothetical protein ACRCVI_02975 [Mycoplasmoidaceae bacterium]